MKYILLFLAVAVGYLIALLVKTKKIKLMPVFLAFSGAFLLSITLFDLLPEVFETPSNNIGVYIMSGILLQIFLEFFSKGAEHGHVHLPSQKLVFPWLLFFSLSIHSLLEGFPISEDNNLLIGIIVHKIPIAVILSLFFINANYKMRTTLVFLLLFSIMTPLGSWISINYEFIQVYNTQLTAVSIGIFLHVSTTILFESSKDHKFDLSKMSAVVTAIILAYFL